MKVEFYKEINRETILLLSKDLPIEEINEYTDYFSKKIKEEIALEENEFLRNKPNEENRLQGDELIKKITFTPTVYKKADLAKFRGLFG